MDVKLGEDIDGGFPLRDIFVEMCAYLPEVAQQHNYLSVSTMLVLGNSNVRSCSSEVMGERESLFNRAILAFRDKNIDPSDTPEYDDVGIFEIQISEPNDDISSYEDSMRRIYMRDGLRYILNAWARHRDRLLLVSYHDEQKAEGFGEGALLEDHVHVVYERCPSDPRNFLQTEIESFTDAQCSWSGIEEALGVAEGPNAFPNTEEYANSEAADELNAARAMPRSRSSLGDDADTNSDMLDESPFGDIGVSKVNDANDSSGDDSSSFDASPFDDDEVYDIPPDDIDDIIDEDFDGMDSSAFLSDEDADALSDSEE